MQKEQPAPLSPQTRSALKIVFLTIFLDLVGFSIMFPLFPALANHYLTTQPDNYFLKLAFTGADSIAQLGGQAGAGHSLVLFGGILGALYSLLQFVFSPIWGSLSDRIGRRPVLMITTAGMALSYVLWVFSGSFTLLVVSRVLGGIMGGNISTATAAVSDVTDASNRSRGMAFIGIAFGLGFILGPAIGGGLSLIDLTKMHPQWIAAGINPFSAAALAACVLSLLNFFSVWRNLKETLPPEKRGQHTVERSNNPIRLFTAVQKPGIKRTNLAYFFFLSAFSGMEFTLTFLAAERLSYTPKQNAMMFVYVGLLIAFIQGGFVRRQAHRIGEKRLAAMGLLLVIPGLLLISRAYTTSSLYFGLAFLAFGAATIVPCLTSLVSLYADSRSQGQAIGVFRSLGALARVVGPFTASVIYWRYGSVIPYVAGALFLLLPASIVARLPNPTGN